MDYLLELDIGTSGVKDLLVFPEGKIIYSKTESYRFMLLEIVARRHISLESMRIFI